MTPVDLRGVPLSVITPTTKEFVRLAEEVGYQFR
jgi:hypothetical protein